MKVILNYSPLPTWKLEHRLEHYNHNRNIQRNDTKHNGI